MMPWQSELTTQGYVGREEMGNEHAENGVMQGKG